MPLPTVPVHSFVIVERRRLFQEIVTWSLAMTNPYNARMAVVKL